MIKLDDDLLAELGLQRLPADHRRTILAALYEELETRVGLRLAGMMTSRQLDEFDQFIKANNKESALAWLEANFPDYRQVVDEEFGKLRVELRDGADDVVVLSRLYLDVTLTPTVRVNPWER